MVYETITGKYFKKNDTIDIDNNKWRYKMKDKILLFIIGVLVGAVIATGAFFVYQKASTCNNNEQKTQIPGGNPPSMPNEQDGNNGQPPEKPDESNKQNNS